MYPGFSDGEGGGQPEIFKHNLVSEGGKKYPIWRLIGFVEVDGVFFYR